jgi:hypothetical protein
MLLNIPMFRGIHAACGPYYTTKKLKIAEDPPPAAVPIRILSAIEHSRSRIRTSQLPSFIRSPAKSSVIIILHNNHFGALRANSTAGLCEAARRSNRIRSRINGDATAAIPVAVPQLVS